jgi:hypothetical protein
MSICLSIMGGVSSSLSPGIHQFPWIELLALARGSIPGFGHLILSQRSPHDLLSLCLPLQSFFIRLV